MGAPLMSSMWCTLRELRALHEAVGRSISDYEGVDSAKETKQLRGLQKSLALRINQHPRTRKKDRV